MKTGLFLAALVQLAAAQPHRAQRHARLHQKRVDDVVVTTQYVTATAPDAVVFVNGDGTPVSTSYASGYTGQPVSSVVTAPAAVAAAPTEHAQHHHHHHHHKDNTPAPAAAAPAPAAPAPAPAKHHNDHSSSASSSDSQGGLHSTASNQNANLGITYTAYNSDGSCKTQDEVNSDFDRFDTYQFVRIYGVDCEQLVTVPTAAAAKGMKVMIGAFDYPPTQDVQTMISTFKGDWSTVETVNVANEIVNQGIDSAAGLVENINAARTALRAAGYGGPVVASDVFSTVLENPTICQNSDFAAANAHAFFDSDVVASNAGSWVKNVYNQLQQKCQKRVVITESGWPNQGQANGAAVPGFTEQTEAISGIVNQFKDIGNMFVFTAFDDMWKTNFDGSFGTEQFWGIMSGQ